MLWNTHTTTEFVKLYSRYVEENPNTETYGNKSAKWLVLAKNMSERLGSTWEPSQLKNKMAVLKTDFKLYEQIVNFNGTGKDARLSEASWQDLIRINPRVVKFKREDFAFYDIMLEFLNEGGPSDASVASISPKQSLTDAKHLASKLQELTDADRDIEIAELITDLQSGNSCRSSSTPSSDSDSLVRDYEPELIPASKKRKFADCVVEAVNTLSKNLKENRDFSRNQIKRCLAFLATLNLTAPEYAKAVRVVKECLELFDVMSAGERRTFLLGNDVRIEGN